MMTPKIKTYSMIYPQVKIVTEDFVLHWALDAIDDEMIPGPASLPIDQLAKQLSDANIMRFSFPDPVVKKVLELPPIRIRRNHTKDNSMCKNKKRHNQQYHARERFLERYGVVLSRVLRNNIIRDIQGGKYPLVERQSLRVSIFAVTINDKLMHVVYDRQRKELVTVLYPNSEQYYAKI
jgi:hypothetical protein